MNEHNTNSIDTLSNINGDPIDNGVVDTVALLTQEERQELTTAEPKMSNSSTSAEIAPDPIYEVPRCNIKDIFKKQANQYHLGVKDISSKDLKNPFESILSYNNINKADIQKNIIKDILNQMENVVLQGGIYFSAREIKMSQNFNINAIKNELSQHHIGVLLDRATLVTESTTEKTRKPEIAFYCKSIQNFLESISMEEASIEIALNTRFKALEPTISNINTNLFHLLTKGSEVEMTLLNTAKILDDFTGDIVRFTVPIFTLDEISLLLDTLNTNYKAELVNGNRILVTNVLNEKVSQIAIK